jgi:acyl-CoA reductase-like NAD-dependent aldehyde dehydrogenase
MPGHDSIVGKFVAEHPEVLLSLLVPAAHYVWNRYNIRNRKQSLRQQIGELLHQRESLAKVAELEHGSSVLEDIENDLKAAIAALAPANIAAAVRHTTSSRVKAKHWLLLYKPSGVASWMLHALFFLNLITVALGLIGALTSWDQDSPDALLGLALFLIPAYFLAWMAHRVERSRLTRAASA